MHLRAAMTHRRTRPKRKEKGATAANASSRGCASQKDVMSFFFVHKSICQLEIERCHDSMHHSIYCWTGKWFTLLCDAEWTCGISIFAHWRRCKDLDNMHCLLETDKSWYDSSMTYVFADCVAWVTWLDLLAAKSRVLWVAVCLCGLLQLNLYMHES